MGNLLKDKYFEYNTGIEPDDESDFFNDPFNPEDISISSKTVSMDTCLRRIIQNTIILNPNFQRNEVWDLTKKSQLIESLMLKIPLPMFYVSADEKNKYTVVDGLQRLSTIRSFILGDDFLKTKNDEERGNGFKLKNLEFWKDYENDNFNDLPNNIKNNILETEFTFTIINPGTPEEVRRNIFKRINTGGLPLSSQEIRSALYIGQATNLLNELAKSQEFLMATDNSVKSIRMADMELILRFLAFLIRDYTTYKKTISVDTFLSDTMIIINAMPDFNSREFHKLITNESLNLSDIMIDDTKVITDYFKKAMVRSKKLFGKHTFRKSYGNKPKSPINKSLFETWGVLLSKLSEKEFSILLKNKEQLMDDYRSVLEDRDFQIKISRDSMKHQAVQSRFEKINNLINKYNA